MLKPSDGWKEGSVKIRVLCRGVKQKEEEAPEFIVDGILYWDIVEVITAELEDPDAFNNIHTTPYKEWWYPLSDAEPVCVYSETYNSDAMLQADKEMREHLQTAGDQEDRRAFVFYHHLLVEFPCSDPLAPKVRRSWYGPKRQVQGDLVTLEKSSPN